MEAEVTARRVTLCAVLALSAFGMAQTNEWADRFAAWHERNEFRGFGHASSADLAWWESYLLQAYLPMFEATGDTRWLDRLTAHADTMFAVMRDVPDSGNYWPGYRDGYLGWGTTRYDPNHQYQEYLVHDAHICLPVARFIRLVFDNTALHAQYLDRARHYLALIEQNVIAKWYHNWNADRGTGEALSSFGGWRSLPLNQTLVFGELLLELSHVHSLPSGLSTSGLPSSTTDSMAAVFKRALLYQPELDAYAWSYWPEPEGSPHWEDLSHATLDVSFALAMHGEGRAFSDLDLFRFGNTLTRVMWDSCAGFRRYVNGAGTLDSTGNLAAWLRLAEYQPDCWWQVKQVLEANPDRTSPTQTSAEIALVLATMAELQPRFPDASTPSSALSSQSAIINLQSAIPHVSPNPFHSSVLIRLPSSLQTANPKLVIVDASGRLVASNSSMTATPSGCVWTPSSDTPAGIYLIRTESASTHVIYTP